MATSVKTSLVIGAGGQDGSFLVELLQQRGDTVVGLSRGGLKSPAALELPATDLTNREQVFGLVRRLKPDEIYYLAAYQHSSEDADLQSNDSLMFERSYAVNAAGLIHFLDAVARSSPATRLFYAASSHIFGTPATQPQTEWTPMNPESVYAITKAAGIYACRYFRRERGVFASVGILYNHESERRLPKFLGQKIIRGALAFKRDNSKKIILGDLSATVDWGYAPDYVEAMTRILGHTQPDEFIVATGLPHTVGDFLQIACEAAGVDWRECVQTRPGLLKRKSALLLGDSTKLREQTGWKPTVTFREMVRLLVEKAARAEATA